MPAPTMYVVVVVRAGLGPARSRPPTHLIMPASATRSTWRPSSPNGPSPSPARAAYSRSWSPPSSGGPSPAPASAPSSAARPLSSPSTTGPTPPACSTRPCTRRY
jgi:hypothetical protein